MHTTKSFMVLFTVYCFRCKISSFVCFCFTLRFWETIRTHIHIVDCERQNRKRIHWESTTWAYASNKDRLCRTPFQISCPYFLVRITSFAFTFTPFARPCLHIFLTTNCFCFRIMRCRCYLTVSRRRCNLIVSLRLSFFRRTSTLWPYNNSMHFCLSNVFIFV